MDSPVRRSGFEADCHWTNDLGDRKWAINFWRKIITDGSERNIFRRKLHLLINDVDGRHRPLPIGLSLSACPHLEEGLSGPAPGASAPLDEGMSGGDSDFGFHTRINRWLVHKTTFKWR